MKRACIIVTDAPVARVALYDNIAAAIMNEPKPLEVRVFRQSEQLLADLRVLVEPYPDIDEWNAAAAHVRAWLPKEDEDE